MVKLKTELVTEKEPREGYEYMIDDVKEITTPVQNYKGIRVSMHSTDEKDVDKNEVPTKYATILWTRESAGLMSKLGAFIEAFSVFLDDSDPTETDNWKGHVIMFLLWQPKRREIEVTA